jgi:hypothetical protein
MNMLIKIWIIWILRNLYIFLFLTMKNKENIWKPFFRILQNYFIFQFAAIYQKIFMFFVSRNYNSIIDFLCNWFVNLCWVFGIWFIISSTTLIISVISRKQILLRSRSTCKLFFSPIWKSSTVFLVLYILI